MDQVDNTISKELIMIKNEKIDNITIQMGQDSLSAGSDSLQ